MSEDAQVSEETSEEEPRLSLQDISAAVQIIDVATSRGAIRGEELLPVGTVRSRFMDFLEHAKANGQDIDLPGQAQSGDESAAA